jgi:hypothetical protein
VSAARTVTARSLKTVQQRASHAHLFKDVSGAPAPPFRSRRGRVDAIVVPASRPASFLRRTIELSALLGVFLVVLCSKQTKLDDVAKRVARTPGARSLIAKIPDGWTHTSFPTRTSAPEFRKANAERASDLSVKRNIGLLLARLHGWSKVVFVDDDITSLPLDSIARLAGKLEKHQVAGLVVNDFPDNSVVCHARRLANLDQDVFVTGAVLGVQCTDRQLSYFPDIYNEDWFFFAKDAAARDLPRVGHARQAPYDPFESPDRARREEFGDLLAEGLYALMDEVHPSVPFEDQLRAADATYWSRFIDARREVITKTYIALDRFVIPDAGNRTITAALESLEASEDRLAQINADLCVSFLDEWWADLSDWQTFSDQLSIARGTREAMETLELTTWRLAQFGDVIDSEAESTRVNSSVGFQFKTQSPLEPTDIMQELALSG